MTPAPYHVGGVIWLPALAQAVGAKPPRHVPEWLGRLGRKGFATLT